MKEYFRETIRNESDEVPSDILYEVDDGKVLKVVEVDRDGSFYWNDIDCYKSGDEPDDYRIRRGSLKEHDFRIDDDFIREESKYGAFWRRTIREEFYRWYEQAKNFGKRRYEVGVGTYLVED